MNDIDEKTVIVNLEEETNTESEPKQEVSELDKAYMELGKAFYEGRYEEPTPELILYFDRITNLLNVKEDQNKVKAHILPIQEEQSISSLDDLPVIEKDASMEESVPSFCPNCGAKHNPGDFFCGLCGTKLK